MASPAGRKGCSMSRRLWLFSVFFLAFAAGAFAAPLTEQQKLDILFKAFDEPGFTFFADGKAHNGVWTKKYLLDRMENTSPPVRTVDEFITRIANTSENGRPFVVRVKNGRAERASHWLRRKLGNINREPAQKNAPPPAPAAKMW